MLILAYLYQTTLIALNRETVGVRTLVAGALVIVPWSHSLRCTLRTFRAPLMACLLVGLGLVLAGYSCLAREGRQPAWHHHLARPGLASLAMIPVCLALKHYHVLLAVVGGAVYVRRRVGGPRRFAAHAPVEASSGAAGTPALTCERSSSVSGHLGRDDP